MSTTNDRKRWIGALAVLACACGFFALQYSHRIPEAGPGSAASPGTAPGPDEAVARAREDARSAEPGPATRARIAEDARRRAGATNWKPLTFDPQFHVYIPQEHENHEYGDKDLFNTDTLKVYAHNGDALAAFFVGRRLFWSDPEAGAQYLKLATILSGKAGPLDVLAKKYSRGRIEDFEQAYLLGYAAASIGFYEGYEEIVPKTERILWRRYDRVAAQDPEFSAEEAMARLRARRAEIVRELNRSPLIQIDDSVDYPLIDTSATSTSREGE